MSSLGVHSGADGKSVLLYSVLLTTASALAVAGVALWWVPGMTVAVALALGAAVSPPDPVAVEAVAEPVGIPRRFDWHASD